MPGTARVLLRGLALILTLAAVGYAVKLGGVAGIVDTAWVDSQVRGQGMTGLAVFLGVGALLTAVGLPRQLVSFLGGYAFGFVEGTALALATCALGCATAFTCARWLARAPIAARFPGRVRRVDAFLRGHTFSMTLLIRLLPFGSNLLTNLAAGVSSAGAVAFIFGSALGYVPQTAVFALVGSGIHLDTALRLGLSAALFVASATIGIGLYRKVRGVPSVEDNRESPIAANGTGKDRG